MKDKYFGIQIRVINGLNMTNDDIRNPAQPILASLAQTDPNNLVRAAAITALGKLKASGNINLFKAAMANQSFAVESAAFSAIALLDPAEATKMAKDLEKDAQGALAVTIMGVYLDNGTSAQWPFIKAKIDENPALAVSVFRKMPPYLGRIDNPAYVQQGITILKNIGLQFKAQGAGPVLIAAINSVKDARAKMNDTASVAAAEAAVKEIGN